MAIRDADSSAKKLRVERDSNWEELNPKSGTHKEKPDASFQQVRDQLGNLDSSDRYCLVVGVPIVYITCGLKSDN